MEREKKIDIEKAKEIMKDAAVCPIVKISAGVFIQPASALIECQAEAADEDEDEKARDYSRHPYWITTDDAQIPIGIDGPKDIVALDQTWDARSNGQTYEIPGSMTKSHAPVVID